MSDLPAGRELDARIAKKVFGCTLMWVPHIQAGKKPHCTCDDRSHEVLHHRLGMGVKPYSTDIKAAWGVVEKIDADCLKYCPQDDKRIWIQFTWAVSKASTQGVSAFGSTAAHAICLAALKACG